MKDRFNLTNLPLSFFDDFHCIEADELKPAVIDVVNLLYDDYSVEEVKEMFSTFATTCYEFYTLIDLFRSDRDSEFAYKLNQIIEALLYCASQLETYKIRQFRQKYVRVTAKVAPHC